MDREPQPAMPLVGQSLPRVDGVAKVTGRARYVDDLPGTAWVGLTVRSTVPHGRLTRIAPGSAFAATGAILVTADDIAAWGGHNTILLIGEDQPALVPIGGCIRHVDEAVALVAAPTAAQAWAAAQALEIDVTPLPAVLTLDAALAATIPLEGDDNVYKRYLLRKGHASDAELEAAFAQAAHVIEGTYATPAQEQMYIEPQGMMAEWQGERCEVTGSMQCPYYVHKALKRLLGKPDAEVVVTQAVTGGGFGGKEEYPSMLAAHVALLARKAGTRVKMIYDRHEDLAATTKRHPARVHHRLALDANGDPMAIDVDVIMDGGAYMTLSPVVLSRGVLHAAGPYKCPVVRIVGRVLATNYPPHGAFRGFGAPQTTFAYERQTAKAARLLGVDPLALRARWALRVGDTTATGQLLTASVGTDGVLAALANVAGPAPEPRGYNAQGSPVRRGRGVCFYFHGSGFTGSGEARLAGRATVAATTRGFEVRASSTDIGQGAATMFTQICADALGVAPGLVEIIDPCTADVPDSGPTVASRTCMVVGAVVARAATALRAQLCPKFGQNVIDAARAYVAVHGELAVTEQYAPPPGIVWDDATYTGQAYPVFGWAACLVEVEIDEDTGHVRLLRCVQAVDVGKAINPIVVKGQIEGGTLQALGWAVLEDIVYDQGRVRNASMANCIVPTFVDAPELETIIVEEPYAFGPSGAKGVGELPMDGPAVAVANAVEAALGCAFDELPISPERVLAKRAQWSEI